MNWDRIEGSWDTLKGKLKEKWAKLTDDDLKLIAGKKDKLVGKLRERYGHGKDVAERDVDTWVSSIGEDETKAPRH